MIIELSCACPHDDFLGVTNSKFYKMLSTSLTFSLANRSLSRSTTRAPVESTTLTTWPTGAQNHGQHLSLFQNRRTHHAQRRIAWERNAVAVGRSTMSKIDERKKKHKQVEFGSSQPCHTQLTQNSHNSANTRF